MTTTETFATELIPDTRGRRPRQKKRSIELATWKRPSPIMACICDAGKSDALVYSNFSKIELPSQRSLNKEKQLIWPFLRILN